MAEYKQVNKPASEIKVGELIDTSRHAVESVTTIGNEVITVIKGLGTFTQHVRQFVTQYVKKEDGED